MFGIPSIAVEESIADSFSLIGKREACRVLDDAVLKRLTTYDKVQAAWDLRTGLGRRVPQKLRSILYERLLLPDHIQSHLELRLANVITKAKFPKPSLQYAVANGPQHFYLDLAWPGLKIGVEADGFDNHGKSRKRFDDDRRRQNFLLSEGWIILRFTHTMSDAELITAIEAAFRLRS